MKLLTKTTQTLCTLLLAAGLLAGCTTTETTQSGAGTAQNSATSTGAETTAKSSKVKEEDLDDSWDAASATLVTLSGSSITVDGDGAAAEGSVLTISQAGTYVLSGSLTDGQVVVNAPEAALVRLVLNDVTITSSTTAPINCEQADKLVVILAEGSENILTDPASYVFPDAATDEPSAALFSKADLTINGSGSLTVNASYNNGIGTKDDLILVSGSYTINAANHAIRGRDSVTVLDGTLVLDAGNDGIQANNTDADKGWIEIYGGSFQITSVHDGVQAETSLAVYGGDFTITAGGGSANAEERVEQGPGGMGGAMPGGGRGGFAQDGTMPEMPGGTQQAPDAGTPPDDASTTAITLSATGSSQTDAASEEAQADAQVTEETDSTSDSYKGLKAGTDLSVTGGTIAIDSADDAIHANGNVTLSGGSMTLATGDDGVHADGNLLVEGEVALEITESYEGLEGSNVTITGGDIHITASDDGINAAGGADANTTGNGFGADNFSASGDYLIRIEGGTIVVNAGTDGLDSNGDIEVTGGVTVVNMTTLASGGEGILDRDGNMTISGGIVVGAGGNGLVTMGRSSSDSSTQALMEVYLDSTQAAGTTYTLTDEQGNTILSYTPTYQHSALIFSTPELVDGNSYTLTTGGSADGEIADGLYTGTASGGTELFTATLAGSVTTLDSSGQATSSGGMGGGGGMGGRGGMNAGNANGAQTPPDGQPNAEAASTEQSATS